MLKILKVIFFSIFFFYNFAKAAVLVSSDQDYYSYKSGNFNYIFPKEYESLIPKIIQQHDVILEEYVNSYQQELPENMPLIIASKNQQVANGFVTIVPNTFSTFYGGGASILDTFASRSWLYALLTHESAHMFQLEAKTEFAEKVRSVFGNAILPVSPIPFFPFPNFITPTVMLEGNAVFNESRFGNGGRLYSGEYWAFFLSFMNSSKINETRMTNNELDFPFGTEKYIVGGFFNYYLASLYGTDRVNQFFLAQADHYILPLIFSSTFRTQFGKNYQKLTKEFIQKYKTIAVNQKNSVGKTLFKSYAYEPLNADNDKIYFLSLNKLKRPAKLNLINKKTKEWKQLPDSDYPAGKIFEYEPGKFASGTAQIKSANEYIYGLWDEDKNMVGNFNSQIILDIKKGNILYFPYDLAIDEPILFKNGERIDTVNSSAILDNDGNTYYFKQQGKIRTLYKNRDKLFEYKGYYGKILEVSDNNCIWFIASSEFGSTLYNYKISERKFYRVSQSDTIVEARIINSQEALVVEFTPNYYEYKIIPLTEIIATPYDISYFFEHEPLFKAYDQVYTRDSSIVKSNKYNSLSSIRYDSLYTSLGVSRINNKDEYSSRLSFAFSDPLNYHSINTTLALQTDKNNEYLFTYKNSIHLINWYSTFIAKEDRTYENQWGIIYPIKLTNNFSLQTDPALDIKKEDGFNVGHYLSIQAIYQKQYMATVYPYRHYEMSLEHYQDPNEQVKSLNAITNFDLYKELNFSLAGNYQLSDTSEIDYWGDGIAPNKSHQFFVPYKNVFNPAYKSNKISFVRVGGALTQVLESDFYSAWFPIGVRRIIPKYFFNQLSYKFNQYSDSYIQKGYGVGLELLLAHLAPVTIEFYNYQTSHHSNNPNIEFRLQPALLKKVQCMLSIILTDDI
ncbi:MAG: hypothetical protein U0T83_08920 [Bacteriovoracaceae bacterium]